MTVKCLKKKKKELKNYWKDSRELKEPGKKEKNNLS
jgi:hypothetical protein